MAAEFVQHCRQYPVGKVGIAARSEAIKQRRAKNMHRHRFINGCLDRPATFARIRDAAAVGPKIGVLQQSLCAQVKQPGADDAIVTPEFSSLGQFMSNF